MHKKQILIICLLSFTCCIELFGQNSIHMEETFKIDSRKYNVHEFISDYMAKEGFVEANNLLYVGNLYSCTRNGIYKDRLSCKCTISFSIKSPVVMNYSVDSVYVNRTICDGSMKSNDFTVTDFASDDFALYSRAIQESIRTQVRRIRTYASDGIYITASEKNPAFYSLDYIVKDHTISYYRVVKNEDNLPAKQLYEKSEDFFTYAFVNANFVLQTEDKEECYLIGKTISNNEFHYGDHFGGSYTYDVPFVIRVDCRDGRARISINVEGYEVTYSGHFGKKTSLSPALYQPFGITKEGGMKGCTEAFEKTVLRIFNDFEKAIKEGVSPLDNIDNW